MGFIASSIAAKVLAAFASVLLVVMVLGFVAVDRLGVVNDSAVDIRTNWLVATRALGDYQFHTMRFRQVEAAAILAESAEQASKEEATLKAVAADAQKAWTAYEAVVRPGEERALADQIKAGWQAYLALDSKMIEMIAAGDKTAAHGSYVGDMRGAYNGWRDSLAKGIDRQIKGAELAGAKAKTHTAVAASDIWRHRLRRPLVCHYRADARYATCRRPCSASPG